MKSCKSVGLPVGMLAFVMGLLIVSGGYAQPQPSGQDGRTQAKRKPRAAPADQGKHAERRDQAERKRRAPAPDRGRGGAELGPEGQPAELEEDLPPELYDDFNFPDPDRPWGRGRYLDPRRHRPRYDAGRYRGYRRYYDDAYTYRYGVPYRDDDYDYEFERAYRQGLADGRNFERFEIQAERGLSAYRRAMGDGHAAFGAGDYGLAARNFILAARLNQGDPAARICAAHAQVALGHYDPAMRLLRRAFELQPRLAYLPIDIRKAYGQAGDFTKHVATLRAAVKADPHDARLCFLLGYYYFFSNEMERAAEMLGEAARLQPDDSLIELLGDVARLTSPSPPERSREKKPSSGWYDL